MSHGISAYQWIGEDAIGEKMVKMFALVLPSANSDHQIGQLPHHPGTIFFTPRSSPLLGTLSQVWGPFAQKRGVLGCGCAPFLLNMLSLAIRLARGKLTRKYWTQRS